MTHSQTPISEIHHEKNGIHRLRLSHVIYCILHFSSDFVATVDPLADTHTIQKENRFFLPEKKIACYIAYVRIYLHDDHEAVNRHTEKHQVPGASGGLV